MLKRLFIAVLMETGVCAFVALCVLFIVSTNGTLPLQAATAIGISALTLWSGFTTYAILYAADLTSR